MENAIVHLTEEPPAQFALVAVGFIKKNEGSWVGKSPLGGREIDAMESDIKPLLGPIPGEPHVRKLRQVA